MDVKCGLGAVSQCEWFMLLKAVKVPTDGRNGCQFQIGNRGGLIAKCSSKPWGVSQSRKARRWHWDGWPEFRWGPWIG